MTQEAQGWTEQLRTSGESVICVAHDDELIGLLGVSDAVRAGAVIQQLTALGVTRLVLLTGDAPETAQAVADALGIAEVHAYALPEGKLQSIRDLQTEGHRVAMVGGGTNDASALALADVGIASRRSHTWGSCISGITTAKRSSSVWRGRSAGGPRSAGAASVSGCSTRSAGHPGAMRSTRCVPRRQSSRPGRRGVRDRRHAD
ncbi:HAD-IC family P-type ATPase [Streptomyces decoyicus]|uniref:HAD-IC family P-type ATPase n=1 Tax=Streptomyces decoyicus TaxID=249567 RepID=A0ABZ1FWP9_9ACTN|nr:HAD-IC family P-type ATPase [Streptomyces decoyicus]WSB74299.1 HAD-IC family P-type ATPase [Streptomyces decoyicus]